MGYTDEDLKNKHLLTEGMDHDFSGVHFLTSIPMSTILDPQNEVILAYEMNGQPIPLDHGYPLRLIIPGHVGVRNVKWVHKMSISD